MAPAYKLTYFNARARGEVPRWVLSYAGQSFEDVRVDGPDWPALKPKTPMGQLPFLEVDGKTLPQSTSIARYLARKHGLAGQGEWEAATIDALVDYVADASKGYYEWLKTTFVPDNQARSDEVKYEYLNVGIKPYLEGLERMLKQQQDGKAFFFGVNPTWADFAVVIFLDDLFTLDKDILEKYPTLAAHSDKVHGLKGIEEWIAKRPSTPF